MVASKEVLLKKLAERRVSLKNWLTEKDKTGGGGGEDTMQVQSVAATAAHKLAVPKGAAQIGDGAVIIDDEETRQKEEAQRVAVRRQQQGISL